jgi:hypothetical protein
MYQKDYDNLQPFSPIPPLAVWASGRQQMQWPDALRLATVTNRPPPLKTAIPPPLLFFRCSRPARQQSYFFVWMTMRDRWIKRFAASDNVCRQNFFKTHQEWRDILGGVLFKKSIPSDGHFLLANFWISYPWLMFDNEKDALAYRGPLLSDGTTLDPYDFKDSNPLVFDLKRLLCYDIALTHTKYQFEEADDILIHHLDFSPDRQERRWADCADLFRCDICLLRAPPPWENPDLTIKSLWFERFHGFLQDWPAVGSSKHSHLAVQLTNIDNTTFMRALNKLLMVYYSGVAKTLHVIPTLMWTFPSMHRLDQYLSI